ncbi:E3 ubiquitin-protein ligase RNF183-like [Podarcis muralis]
MVECGICYEAYKEASSGQVPKLLWCCHSLCLACLRKLVCQNTAFSFVVCPFCRMVTLVPEAGLQALRNDEALLREIAPQREWKLEDREELGDSKDSPGALDLPLSDSVLTLDMELNYRTGSPIFTVSGIVPVYPATGFHSGPGFRSWFHVQEVQNPVLVELPHRASSRDSEAPASVENLRLCFAVTIILLIVSVFFALVFFK